MVVYCYIYNQFVLSSIYYCLSLAPPKAGMCITFPEISLLYLICIALPATFAINCCTYSLIYPLFACLKCFFRRLETFFTFDFFFVFNILSVFLALLIEIGLLLQN